MGPTEVNRLYEEYRLRSEAPTTAFHTTSRRNRPLSDDTVRPKIAVDGLREVPWRLVPGDFIRARMLDTVSCRTNASSCVVSLTVVPTKSTSLECGQREAMTLPKSHSSTRFTR